MSSLKVFEYLHKGIRTSKDESGNVWFVAKDVCDVLGLDNSREAISDLDDEEKDAVITTDTIGRKQKMATVSESGLYQLIFKSRKEEAKAFKRWICKDVIPAIRRGEVVQLTDDEKKTIEFSKNLRSIRLINEQTPEGFFNPLGELTSFILNLIEVGFVFDDSHCPQISVGIRWAAHWKAENLESRFGSRVEVPFSYPDNYRQAKANGKIDANMYPNTCLVYFKDWLRKTYIPLYFPEYLVSQVKDNKLPATLVATVCKMLQIPAPAQIAKMLGIVVPA